MSKRVLKGKKYELYCRVSWNNIAKVCLLPGKSMFFGFWSKAWNIPNWHFPPLSLMWFGVDNKKTKQSKFEPFVDNNRGIQLFHLFHQQHHCHQHKLPHHHLPILSGRVCYLISSSAMSAAVSPPCIIAHQNSLSSSLNVFVIIIISIMSDPSAKIIRTKHI